MGSRCRSGWLAYVAVLFLSTAACSSKLALKESDFSVPTARVRVNADRHAVFQALFCKRYGETAQPRDPACSHWLSGVPQVGAATITVPDTAHIRSIVIVPGILGECVSQWTTPFSSDYEFLRAAGYALHVIPVTGRGSSNENARLIHDYFSKHKIEQAAVLAYSKGATDFMTAAVQPQAQAWSHNVAAFVTVAGVVNGTPLAGWADDFYRVLLSRAPWPTCPPHDGGGVASLTYQSAMPTASAFAQADKPYRSYSIAAVAPKHGVNPVLALFHKNLSRLDSRNDGQVLLEDAIVSGADYLGAFRADHWSIVLPFEDSASPMVKPLSINNQFPRRALVAALLDFLNYDLAGAKQ